MKQNASSVRSENLTFRALYLIAIVMVVDGHTTLDDIFSMGNLFRYYSFHLMLFAFGAGYFFKQHGGILSDLAARAKKLLVPLYIWNIVYGVGAAILRRFGGFEIGEPLSLYTLLVAPITNGEHFVWNLGSWFIFPLFLSQTIYSLIRRCAKIWKDNEWITFVLCLLLGCAGAQICHINRQDLLPLFLLRTLILLPGYAGGQLYRRRLERHDTLPTAPYLIGIVILRALLCVRYENLAYLLSKGTFFVCDPFGVYFGAALAIAFFLRIARLIAPLMERSRLALYASRHTFDIMMHHFMGFFALNSMFLILNALGVAAADFSVKSFRTTYDYNYAPYGRSEWNILYLLAGIFFALIVAWGTDKIKLLFKKKS